MPTPQPTNGAASSRQPRQRSSILIRIGLIIPACIAVWMFIAIPFGNQGPSIGGLVFGGFVVGVSFMLSCMVLPLAGQQGTPRTFVAFCLPWVAIALVVLAGYVAIDVSVRDSTPPPLATEMQDDADQLAEYFSPFLTTGASGPVVRDTWNGPSGEQVSIAVTLKRNKDGVLVEAFPLNRIDWLKKIGAPASKSRQILDNGMLVYSLDYFKKEAAASRDTFIDLAGPVYEMFNEVCMGSGGKILDWARAHDGQLPSAKEAAEILSKSKKTFVLKEDPLGGDVGKGGAMPNKTSNFLIKSYTYRLSDGGRFAIEAAWDYPLPAHFRQLEHGEPSFSGTWVVEYGLPDVLAFRPQDTPLQVAERRIMELQKKQYEASLAGNESSKSP